MAVGLGQICAERLKHSSKCYYVYQPTGVGDWYRWRLVTAQAVYGSGDDTYWCLCGCCRGYVYAGAQKAYSDSDANSGFTTASSWRGLSGVVTNVAADYREFNVPTGMTHVRVFARAETTYGKIRCTAYAGAEVVGYVDWDGALASACPQETAWYGLPVGTTKVRISKDTNDSKYIFLQGVDWCQYGAVVDPDTAGSVMWYTTGDPASRILLPYHWGVEFINPPSTELALFWADDGGAYSATKCAGGISHRGINTATVAIQTQTGTDAPAAWSANQGDKLACDYVIFDIQTARVYQELACTNYRGTLTGKLIFDATGCLIDHAVTVDQGVDMDLFQLYSVQCSCPLTLTKTYFSGDTQVRNMQLASITPNFKTTRLEAWGGPNRTHYTVELFDPDTVFDFYHNVGAASQMRWNYDATRYKVYANYYDNSSTPMALPNGSSISTRFFIRLRDRKLAQRKLVRLL